MTRRPTPPSRLLEAAKGVRPEASAAEQLDWAAGMARREAAAIAREEVHTVGQLADSMLLLLAQMSRRHQTADDLRLTLEAYRTHIEQLEEDWPRILAALKEVMK